MQDILSSDIMLWDAYTLKESLPDGSVKAILRPSAYPEGWSLGPITGRIVGDTPVEKITSWYNFVKGKFDAWETSKETQASSGTSTPESGGGGKDGASGELGGGSKAATGNLSDGEVSLEELLQSKVASLRRSVSLIEEEIASTSASLAALRARRIDACTQARLAEKALKAATGGNTRSKEVAP